MLRLFVALPLPTEVLALCEEARAGLIRILGPLADSVRFTRSEGLHFTLKFLGETPVGLLAPVRQRLSAALAGREPFDVQLGALGAFPTMLRPRVGYLEATAGEIPMARLVMLLEAALAPLGFSPEIRPFAAHLTLFRLRAPRDAAAVGHRLVRFRAPSIPFVADRLILYRSELRPGGSLYTPLEIYPLEPAVQPSL